MGKVKTIDPEEQELKAKEKAKKEAERLARIEIAKAAGQAKKSKAESVRGGEKGVARDGVPQNLSGTNNVSEAGLGAGERQDTEAEETKEKKTVSKYKAKKAAQGRKRSENYKKAAAQVDKSKQYSTKEALQLLEKAHLATFDESVELHINTVAPGLSGQVTLPHGTGKKVRVAIIAPSKDSKAADDLLKEIEAGKINFDILIATPDAMPKLAKVAKILGPKGLLPNPKNGTITNDPERLALSYAKGQMYFKTEAKMPLLHATVGKLSFGQEKLTENIEAFLKAVKMENIKKIVIKSTMSPAIRLQLEK